MSADAAASASVAEIGESEVHGTCVAALREDAGEPRWSGLLLLGASGVGKSALALGLIARGARLVADDRVRLSHDGAGAVRAAAVSRARRADLAGLIEARGLGLLRMPVVESAPINLVCRLISPENPQPRLPRRVTIALCGAQLPLIATRPGGGLADALYCLLRSGALVDPEAPLEQSAEGLRE